MQKHVVRRAQRAGQHEQKQGGDDRDASRGRIAVPVDAAKEAILAAAKADENVQRFTQDKTLRKEILVPGKLVNLVVA